MFNTSYFESDTGKTKHHVVIDRHLSMHATLQLNCMIGTVQVNIFQYKTYKKFLTPVEKQEEVTINNIKIFTSF